MYFQLEIRNFQVVAVIFVNVLQIPDEIYDNFVYGTLSPLLANFERVQFKTNGTSSFADTSCALQQQQPPRELSREPLRWQPVPTTSSGAFVFSAFYDHRWNPPVLVIVGLVSDYWVPQDGPRQRHCRVWFRGDETPRLIAAAVRIVPEHHGRK